MLAYSLFRGMNVCTFYVPRKNFRLRRPGDRSISSSFEIQRGLKNCLQSSLSFLFPRFVELRSKKVCLNNEQLRNHRKLNQWKFFTNNRCRTRNATFFHGESRGHSTTTGLLLKSESCWIGMKPCDFALANEDHEGRK